MSMTFDQFVKETNCEIVAGRLIIGEQDLRRFVGEVAGSGVFNLNENGQIILKSLEEGRSGAEAIADADEAHRLSKLRERDKKVQE